MLCLKRIMLIGCWVGLTAGMAWESPCYAWQEDEAQKTSEQPAKPKRKPIYDEAADAESQIAKAVAKARKENKRVLLQWGANWCGWCHLLHDAMKSDEIARKVLYEYEVVLVDVGRMDRNLELAAKYEADINKQGLPFITILDGEGRVVANQETSSLESKEKGVQAHDREAVMNLLNQHEASPLRAKEVVDQGLTQAKGEKKWVFLHFGAPWCGWCNLMEAWMEQPEVAAILNKAFVDVKVDTDRMVGGQGIQSEYCSEPSGIPWFVFIDGQRPDVQISSQAKSGNIGFPSTDEEIAAFVTMLEKTNRLTASDIAQLKESLVANRVKREGK